jgi:hypothetical protein
MTLQGAEQHARLAAMVNGLLVFGVPTSFLLLVTLSSLNQPWPADIAALRPTPGGVLLETLQFALVFALLGLATAWRTRVHARRFIAGVSAGWGGVGEAAVCGFVVALLYLAPGILRRPGDALPYVAFYGTAAAIVGTIVGTFLRVTARIVLR